MITISDQTTIVGIAELRKEISEIIAELKGNKIILTKRGKPVGVLENFEDYEKKQKIIDQFEDLVLGYLAKEREEKSKKYISQEEMEKRVGLSK